MAENNNTNEISAKKIAHWAEKGFKVDELTNGEKDFLLRGGLAEVCTIRDNLQQTIPALGPDAVDKIIQHHFPEPECTETESIIDLCVRVLEKGITLVKGLAEWQYLDPAPVYRGDDKQPVRDSENEKQMEEEKQVSYRKEFGKITVYLDIMKKKERCVDLVLRLKDISSRDQSSFKVELLKGDRCLEAIKTNAGSAATLSDIEIGNYKLRLLDTHGEVTSIALRMES